MTHQRTRIRHAVAALLAPIAPVSVNRDDPLQAGELLPCLAVFTPGEGVQEITNGRRQLRTMELVVDGYARAGAELDDRLDALALDIEARIAAGQKLGGLADKAVLVRTVTDRVTGGELRAGVVRLTFALTYQTAFGQPDA
ncbi:hypothetical protein [Azospirillum doebereinerae]|uniref:DUF3168 domain-containing protein n=1 Tax=Azospirillum doebereinerae TaxID=92933 RepID=A0A3S0UY93_9PROT|nr:hypothetical protein [Azospirillum doebereinerae]RUQ63985.1 hypothetical protein EJ913_27055 [Azospirillum doebereinerae]